MSVTFWCPEAPRTQCKPYPETDPDFVDEVSELPEINLSNANARAIIDMLGLPSNDGLFGQLQVGSMDAVIARLNSLLNVAVERAAFLEPTTVNGRVVDTATQAAGARSNDAPALFAQCSPRLAAAAAGGAGPTAEATAATVDALLPIGSAAAALADQKRGGPTCINFGRSDEYLRAQATRFLDLFTQAKAREISVCWG